jgi:hypothetical protein
VGRRARRRARAAVGGPEEKPGCQICGTPFVPRYRDGELIDARCENGHTPMQSIQQRARDFDAKLDSLLQPEAADPSHRPHGSGPPPGGLRWVMSDYRSGAIFGSMLAAVVAGVGAGWTFAVPAVFVLLDLSAQWRDGWRPSRSGFFRSPLFPILLVVALAATARWVIG